MAETLYTPFIVDQHITALSRYYAGKIGSRFYRELRDNGKIFGTRCPGCNRVYWPPRQTCGPCFRDMTENDMLEIGPRGTVVSFTRVEYDSPVMPRKAPFYYAVITLDGADTGITHFLDEVGPADVACGMRVEPVFAEERKGTILDIAHFRPVHD